MGELYAPSGHGFTLAKLFTHQARQVPRTPNKTAGQFQKESDACLGGGETSAIARLASHSFYLDHAAVNAVGCHMVRLVGKPNAFPLLQHQA